MCHITFTLHAYEQRKQETSGRDSVLKFVSVNRSMFQHFPANKSAVLLELMKSIYFRRQTFNSNYSGEILLSRNFMTTAFRFAA